MTTLTYRDLNFIYDSFKSPGKSNPGWSVFARHIMEKYNLPDDNISTINNAAKSFIRKRSQTDFRHMSQELKEKMFDEIYIDLAVGQYTNKTTIDDGGDTSKVYNKSLLEICERQRYRRTAPIIEYLEAEAEKNKERVYIEFLPKYAFFIFHLCMSYRDSKRVRHLRTI